MSINVGPAEDQGQRICELNDLTDESPLQTGLQEATGHIHYSAEVSDSFVDYPFMLVSVKCYSRNGNSLMLDTTNTDGNQWMKNVFSLQQFHFLA